MKKQELKGSLKVWRELARLNVTSGSPLGPNKRIQREESVLRCQIKVELMKVLNMNLTMQIGDMGLTLITLGLLSSSVNLSS